MSKFWMRVWLVAALLNIIGAALNCIGIMLSNMWLIGVGGIFVVVSLITNLIVLLKVLS